MEFALNGIIEAEDGNGQRLFLVSYVSLRLLEKKINLALISVTDRLLVWFLCLPYEFNYHICGQFP